MQLMHIPLKTIVVGLVGGSFAVILNMLALVMIGMINQKVTPEQHVSYIHWGSGVKKQFRNLYPESNLLVLVRLCEVGLVLSFIALLWAIGIL